MWEVIQGFLHGEKMLRNADVMCDYDDTDFSLVE
jgi:hypothetical protein